MELFIDKYRPKKFSELTFHPNVNKKFLSFAQDFKQMNQHLLIHGPEGSGKYTRVMAMLHELYGLQVYNIKMEDNKFSITVKKVKSKKTVTKVVKITTYRSNVHIEVNPSDVGKDDRYVVSCLIKEILESKGTTRVILVHNADKLSHIAQKSLTRTMETYNYCCIIILLATQGRQIIPAIHSRCFKILVPSPSIQDLQNVLLHIAKEEKLESVSHNINNIIKASNRNLRTAILLVNDPSFLTCKDSKKFIEIQIPTWKKDINNMMEKFTSIDNSDKIKTLDLFHYRLKLNELLNTSIHPRDILKQMLNYLLENIPIDDMKASIVQYAAIYDLSLVTGQNPIYHLEAFLAKVALLQIQFLDSI